MRNIIIATAAAVFALSAVSANACDCKDQKAALIEKLQHSSTYKDCKKYKEGDEQYCVNKAYFYSQQ